MENNLFFLHIFAKIFLHHVVKIKCYEKERPQKRTEFNNITCIYITQTALHKESVYDKRSYTHENISDCVTNIPMV